MSTLLLVLAVIVVVAFLGSITWAMIDSVGGWATVGIWLTTFAVSAAIFVIILYATGKLR